MKEVMAEVVFHERRAYNKYPVQREAAASAMSNMPRARRLLLDLLVQCGDVVDAKVVGAGKRLGRKPLHRFLNQAAALALGFA